MIQACTGGNREALDRLFDLLYDALRRIAHRKRVMVGSDQTLATTALVHEAFLELVGFERLEYRNRAQFFAIAARVMRRLLLDQAVSRRAAKRGAGAAPVTLDSSYFVDDRASDRLMALEDALAHLERVDPRQCRVVECRFFAGMDLTETADSLGVSLATVKRDWAMARAWLNRALRE